MGTRLGAVRRRLPLESVAVRILTAPALMKSRRALVGPCSRQPVGLRSTKPPRVPQSRDSALRSTMFALVEPRAFTKGSPSDSVNLKPKLQVFI
jgi:hypothetical protein